MIPKLPIGPWLEAVVDTLVEHLSPATRAFSTVIDSLLVLLESALSAPSALLFTLALTVLTWLVTRRKSFTVFCLVGFLFIDNLSLWSAAMSTLALVLVSSLFAIGVGVPLGVLVAMAPRLRLFALPLLDAMQTMPAFVYLIPAIPFFGLGKVSAVFATIIFAMPPVVRFTYLGIRQVSPDLVECAEAFGSTRWQRLVKLELPLAFPTIMAGATQTVMLSLSMVVIAAMIGARGLGGEVWRAIQRLELGAGFEAGLCIVILAVWLDRMMQHLGRKAVIPQSTM